MLKSELFDGTSGLSMLPSMATLPMLFSGMNIVPLLLRAGPHSVVIGPFPPTSRAGTLTLTLSS